MTAPGEVLARWPRVRADLRTDGTGTLSVNDVEHACAAPSAARLRTGVIARCAAIATTVHRPVRLEVTDPLGTQELAVGPDGAVRRVRDDGTLDAAVAPPADASPCRRCEVPQQVTTMTCDACGVLEPHRVELVPVAVLDADALVHPDEEVIERLRATLVDAAPPRAEPAVRGVPVVTPSTSSAPAARQVRAVPAAPVVTPSTSSGPASLGALLDVPSEPVATPPARARRAAPVVARPRSLHLTFSAQPSVTAPDGVSLGRDPAAADGRHPIRVASPGMQVSKTHAFVDVDDRGRVYVTDCRSTNGTRVLSQPPVRLEPGERHEIAPGTTLELGDVRCTVTLVD
ncbi:FHA domain-containing protein [Cellulomonas sp. Leaf334]|uniref:FHA domain-containing protein n=1 Tax=Cellulomonas sp. Leaf334 TaxID=1736339 RepID=UPI0006FE5128|nr:FHA domain-containing protein [Cellulomonas sp. Leaf334]KQR11790.1 hypothetical protein ASF78_11230 [Cellulomonas sp. Leaf334]